MRKIMLIAISLLMAANAWAITDGQMDDFEDGSVMGWAEGAPSPNPPTNMADGGPMGAGDNYLSVTSSGGGGPGSRMVFYNRSQWTGDYQSANVAYVSMYVANMGASDLNLRLGLSDGSSRYVSTTAQVIPADGMWMQIEFALMDMYMTQVGGAGSLGDVLGSVTELRILSSDTAAWQGDALVGSLGVDGIMATSTAVPNAETGWSQVKALYRN